MWICGSSRPHLMGVSNSFFACNPEAPRNRTEIDCRRNFSFLAGVGDARDEWHRPLPEKKIASPTVYHLYNFLLKSRVEVQTSLTITPITIAHFFQNSIFKISTLSNCNSNQMILFIVTEKTLHNPFNIKPFNFKKYTNSNPSFFKYPQDLRTKSKICNVATGSVKL